MSICIREPLTADRTYYVRTDGSDSNTGLENTAGGAFLTIQKAVNVVCSEIDLGLFNVVIQVGGGTYTAGALLKRYLGAGSVTIRGDVSTPANVTVSVSSGRCFDSYAALAWKIEGFTVTTTGSGNNCVHANATELTLGSMRFGASVAAHVMVINGGIFFSASYSIVGGATVHAYSDINGVLTWLSGITATLSGTPNFSNAFVVSQRCSTLGGPGVTWSGTATGIRYKALLNANIDTNGGGANFYPGNAAGQLSAGGQYV